VARQSTDVFPRIDYFDWLEGRREAAMHDLACADLRGDRAVGSAPVPDPVADRPDPPAGVNLHSLVATEYGVHPRQVVVTAGASHAAFVAAATAVTMATTGDEDAPTPRALVEKPGYEPHVQTPVGVGAEVDRFRRTEPDFALDPDRVQSALRDETALVTVTNRHNPSGALADRETLAEAATATREAGAHLLVDEVYAPYLTGAREGAGTAFGGPTAAGLDGAVVVNSLSKFHGLPDLRVGWLVADPEFAERARSVKHHVPAVADTAELLAGRAVYATEDIAADRRALLAENAALLRSFVRDRDDVEGSVHEGSPFAFLDVAGADGDEVAAAAWEAGVLVSPGSFFGDDDRVRVALGRDPEATAAGLDAFAGVLASL
jgi:aspartate/methionine/tyrosine aminotransferase